MDLFNVVISISMFHKTWKYTKILQRLCLGNGTIGNFFFFYSFFISVLKCFYSVTKETVGSSL